MPEPGCASPLPRRAGARRWSTWTRSPRQLRLFEAEFGDRFRLTLSASAGELLNRVDAAAPVAVLLADQTTGRDILEAAPPALADTERLLVARKRGAVGRAGRRRARCGHALVREAVDPRRGEGGARRRAAHLRASLAGAARAGAARSVGAARHPRAGERRDRARAGRSGGLHGGECRGAPAGARGAWPPTSVGVNHIRPDTRVLERLREVAEIIQDVEAGADHVRQVSRGFTVQLRADAPAERCDVPRWCSR